MKKNSTQTPETQLPDPTRLLAVVAERDEVDYKAVFSRNKDDVANTVKVYAAMANVGGGLVIYGVQGTDLKGLSQDQIEDLDPARLGDYLKKYLSPVPRLSTNVVEFQDKKFAFVTVEPTFTAPVLVTTLVNRDGKPVLRPGALYIRENTKSVEAHSEAHARKALDLIVGFQVRARLAELVPILSGPGPRKIEEIPTIEIVARRQAEERSEITPATSVRELILTPKNRTKAFDIPTLQKVFGHTYKLHGLVVPHYAVDSSKSFAGVSEGGIISGFADSPDGRRVFARIDKDGSLYWCSTLLEDNMMDARSTERMKNGIGVGLTLNLFTLAIRLAYAHVDALGLDDGMGLTYSLRNVKDRKLVVEDFSRGDFFSARKCFDQDVKVKVEIARSTPSEVQIGVAKVALVELYQQFNWPNPPLDQIEKDIQDAFRTSHLEYRTLNF